MDLADDGRPLAESLFGEGPSRVVVSVPPDVAPHWERLMGEFGVPWRFVGRVGGSRLVVRRGAAVAIDVEVERCADAWREGFARHVS